MRIVSTAMVIVAVCSSAAISQPPQDPAPALALPHEKPDATIPLDPKLAVHIAGWGKRLVDLKTFRLDLMLSRESPAAGLKDAKEYRGTLIAMKPNLFRLRLENTADPKDFETFLSNGQALYVYNGLQKTVTEYKPGNWFHPKLTDNLLLDLIAGMKSNDLKDRFRMKLFKEDDHHVYIDIEPVLKKDKARFKQLRVALYGPKTDFAYLPARIYVVTPAGETERWSTTNPVNDIPEISEKSFNFEMPAGFRFLGGEEPTPVQVPARD